MKTRHALNSLSDTRQLAESLTVDAARLHGRVIYLAGELGMGKTTLVRYVLVALGYNGKVKSPTYGLLESYAVGGLQVLHVDLYRLQDPEELEYLGLRDLHDEHSLLLVEWAENSRGMLPPADMLITLGETDQQQRVADIECLSQFLS